jgi:signal transduction histidine kinase
LLVGGAIIALFSVGTARSIVKPLDRLVLAAARVGRSREFVPVASEGLHEFSAVAGAFEDIQKRLLRFIDDRTQMLGAMSHDLRSCLTRLRVTAETGSKNETQKILIREIDEMTVMLESTLAFARGEAHGAPSQAIDVAALLISVVDDAFDAGQAVYYAGPDHADIWGVPVSLKRAFRNLIDNAVKYGGVARVSLDVNGGIVRVVIADDGPGIAPERVDEALMPFRRLENARSGVIPGAGLGLTIARDVIVSHGGTMVFRNAATGGLRVEVNFRAFSGDSSEHQRRVFS